MNTGTFDLSNLKTISQSPMHRFNASRHFNCMSQSMNMGFRRKVPVFTILTVLISCIFVIYLKCLIEHLQFREQCTHKIDDKQKLTISADCDVFSNRNSVINDDGCVYYGAPHGMFHPSVAHPRFIVTGGAGFIGSHLVKRLRQNYTSSQIKVLDNLLRGRLHNLQYENGTWSISIASDFCLVDLRNTNEAERYITGADVIFHLAGVVAGVSYVISHQSSIFRDNTLINTNTLHAAKVNNVKSFIYTGTACNVSKFLQEDSSISASSEQSVSSNARTSSHDWSKLIGEFEAELARSDDFSVGILRLYNVYGPYSDFTSTSQQVIPSLIRKALDFTNGSFRVWGSGQQRRDFIYIGDVIDSFILILERGASKGAIQVGSGKETTITELAQIIANFAEERLQRKIKMTFDISQPEGDRGQIAVLNRAKSILNWQPKVGLKEGISATMSWMAETRRKHRTLVIVIGQLRGGDLAWKSLRKFLLRPLNAHLAIYISNWQIRTYLHDIAQYIWTIPEYTDWGIVFEMAAEMCSTDVRGKWRDYCHISGMLGGVINCSHPGSAGILLAFRWLVQQKIVKLQLLDKYDWFVLTRSDELHLCDHHDFTVMNEDHALLPTGEYYGGWSDRHIIGKSDTFMKMINLTSEFICKSEYWYTRLYGVAETLNLEIMQKVFWAYNNITVSEFPRSMFTVRTQCDETRWSLGTFHPDTGAFGLKLKYSKEFPPSMDHCKIRNVTDVLRSLQQYV